MTKMIITAIEEPDVVTPKMKYSPYKTYDVNVWAEDLETLHIGIWRVAVSADDPEEIDGTDYDWASEGYELSVSNPAHHAEIEWWLCDFYSCEDWSEMEHLDEWTTYYGNIGDYEAEAEGNKKPMPISIKERFLALPEYKPREQE
jgi:hypothetical protein